MKIYVICDLEGTAGVIDHRQQCWFDGAYYHQARRLATLELNALVEGALEGGATEIVAWDGHGPFPGGLDVELLHPACRLVMGAGDGGPAGLDESYNATFMCGLHGMAGLPRAVLSHSFHGRLAAVWLNGLRIGEIGMNCAVAGLYGVPTVFVSGDKAAAAEARALVPDIETVVVKEGLSPAPAGLSQAPAISLAPEKARAMIREGARQAMAKVGKIQPFRVEPPYTLARRFTEARFADEAASRPGVRRVDETTVEATGSDLLALEL
ncbi:MAG: M55 family metallopeptidase [Anaerolineae bacterium]|nr:M55 family metallopeptidase [Anaerolineae bacterium]